MIADATEYSHEQILEKLKEYCDRFPLRADAADALGVNRVFLWRVLEGKSPPTVPMLAKIGFKRERQVIYTYKQI